jgi:hypothetical protein
MKKKVIDISFNVSIISYLIFSILHFILSLGFMTNFQRFFYHGSSEMFDFYKNIQVYNKAYFDTTIILVIVAACYLLFVKRKRTNIVQLLLTLIGALLTTLNTVNFLRAIPYYENSYLSLDFTAIDNYKVSTFVFNANRVLIWASIIFSLIILVLGVIRFAIDMKQKREVKLNEGREATI